MDLVAYLIRLKTGYLQEDEIGIVDESNFSFTFYISYPSREQAVGLEMLESFQNLCTTNDWNIFKLVARFSN